MDRSILVILGTNGNVRCLGQLRVKCSSLASHLVHEVIAFWASGTKVNVAPKVSLKNFIETGVGVVHRVLATNLLEKSANDEAHSSNSILFIIGVHRRMVVVSVNNAGLKLKGKRVK